MSGTLKRYLFVKHSENWNVDRCTRWMAANNFDVDWCYPASAQPFPDPSAYEGVVVFGGANSANDCDCHDWLKQELVFVESCLKHDTAFFGICLGAQILARVLGAQVRPHKNDVKEVGFCRVDPVPNHRSFLDKSIMIMQWHSEGFDLPFGTELLATSDQFPNQAFRLSEKVIGVQFHPEVNAEALAIWIERNKQRRPDMLSDEQRATMMSDSHRYDAGVSKWVDGFMGQWTSPS